MQRLHADIIDLLHSCPWGILGRLLWTPVRPERVVRGIFFFWNGVGGGFTQTQYLLTCYQSQTAVGVRQLASTSHIYFTVVGMRDMQNKSLEIKKKHIRTPDFSRHHSDE